MKKCKKCGADIPNGSKVCPSCGAKTNNMIPIIIIIVVVLISLGCCCTIVLVTASDSDSPSSSQSTVSQPKAETPPPAANPETPETPTSSKAEPTSNTQPAPNAQPAPEVQASSVNEKEPKADNPPKEAKEPKEEPKEDSNELSPYYIFNLLSEYNEEEDDDDLAYSLNSKAASFLQEHPSLFPAKKESDVTKYTDKSITFAHIEKNDSKYGDKLMYLDLVSIVQISETELYTGQYFTGLNLIDADGFQYYLYYIGELNDFFKEDIIKVYGLPLGMSSFQNTDGGRTLVPILAGSYVEKVEY